MRRYLKGVESRDLDTVRALIEASDHTLIIGSDPQEWYLGPEAVELLTVATTHRRNYTYDITRLEAFEEGTVGWAAADTVVEFERSEPGETGLKSQPVQLRMTAVFVLDQGSWRIVHWHASAPTPDDPDVVGAELSEAMKETIEAVADSSEVSALTSKLQTNTVSLVFTDIVDSTVLARDAGDVAWGTIITGHLADVDRIVSGRDGVVVKTTGDGAMMAFSSARNAVRAAVDLGRGSCSNGADHPLRLRIGVHTGEAVKTEVDYFGQTVNETARIMAAAQPDQILVSDLTRRLVGDVEGIEFGEPLTVELKGFPGVREVHPVGPVG